MKERNILQLMLYRNFKTSLETIMNKYTSYMNTIKDKFLEIYSLPRLNYKEIDALSVITQGY